ncbi:MAG: hypothetical protein MAG795_00720 [Candidatus Woesearchaeota archaeon]|nr:hypothetical protein [Candidatus Woesearchaeota archaeon]
MIKNMIMADLIKKYPKSVQILSEYGIPCMGCCIATWETVEQCAKSYEIDIDKLTTELSTLIHKTNFEVIINETKNSMQ